jgi:cell division protein FtsX
MRYYFFQEWKANLRARPLITLLVVFLTAGGLLATVLLGGELKRARTWWADRFADSFIEVYLDPSVTDEEATALRDALAVDSRLRQVTYVSTTAARQEAEAYLGTLAFSVLPENPLPASLRLELALQARSPASVRQLTDSLAGIAGISEIVSPDRQLAAYARGAEIIADYTKIVIAGSLCWTVIWLFLGVFLVGRARVPSWRIWHYLGARSGWFRWPLIIEGAMVGLSCTLVAGLCIHVMLPGRWSGLDSFPGTSAGIFPWLALPVLLGALAGWLAYRIHRRHSMTF